MDLDTWVSLAVIIGTGFTITAFMLRAIGKLDTKIDTVNENLDSKITEARKEARTQNEALDTKIDRVHEKLDTKIDRVGEHLDTKIDTVNKNLDTKITAARKEAKEGNDSLRESMEAAFGRIETRLTSLEQRTYDIKPGTSSHTG